MEKILGSLIAERIRQNIADEISNKQIKPGLAVVLIGNDPASEIYVSLKQKAAEQCGFEFKLFKLNEDVEEQEILNVIDNCNQSSDVHGMIVQLPLPEKFNTEKIINAIDASKDVDGFHPENIKLFNQGQSLIWPVLPKAILALIKSTKIALENKTAIVVAHSDYFGQVMQNALNFYGVKAEYVLYHSEDFQAGKINNKDIVVSVVGHKQIIKSEMIKDGAVVIDAGIVKEGMKLFGDIDQEGLECKNGFVAPVPGGVGPVTIACLLENTLEAYKLQNGLK